MPPKPPPLTPSTAYKLVWCKQCRRPWRHNAGPQRNFQFITRICPRCIPGTAAMIIGEKP